MKTYHAYHNECQQSEIKHNAAESRREGLEKHASKGTLSRKHKAVKKNADKVSKSRERGREGGRERMEEREKMESDRGREDGRERMEEREWMERERGWKEKEGEDGKRSRERERMKRQEG